MTEYRRVILESPFAAPTTAGVRRHIAYARACIRDSLDRDEAPFASHLLYTQRGILNDRNPDERKRGIDAGLAWGTEADLTVVYIDLGVTQGMLQGIERAMTEGRPVEQRSLPDWADNPRQVLKTGAANEDTPPEAA